MRHIIGHFGDVLPSQCLGIVSSEKLNLTQQKQTRIRNKIYYNIKLGLPLTSNFLLEYSSEYINEYSSNR